MDAVDRRGLSILGWLVFYLALADLFASSLGLKYMLAVEWPTDLFALAQVQRGPPIDVGIVGSSRSHYGLMPKAVEACLAARQGRPARVELATRVTASAYTVATLAADLFTGSRQPRALVVEVAPDALARDHFEQRHNVATSMELADLPACLGEVPATRLRPGDCLRPLVRGVENLAFLFHRPFTDHAHLTWMALVEGGGQYCAGAPGCAARNADYDRRHTGRWQTRVDAILPKVATERFGDYAIDGGLSARAFLRLLDDSAAQGVTVLAVNLPVSAAYQAEIPPSAYARFDDWILAATAARGARYVDWNTGAFADRALYIDPDHLNATGAQQASAALCAELALALH